MSAIIPADVKEKTKKLLNDGKKLCDGLILSANAIRAEASPELINSHGSIGHNAQLHHASYRALSECYADALSSLNDNNITGLTASVKEIRQTKANSSIFEVIGEAEKYQQNVNGVESNSRRKVAECNPSMHRINEALKISAELAKSLRTNMTILGDLLPVIERAEKNSIRETGVIGGGFHTDAQDGPPKGPIPLG